MKVEVETVREYIKSQDEIKSPEVQKKFALTYIETKSIIDDLVKEGILEYVSGITYKTQVVVNSSNEQTETEQRNFAEDGEETEEEFDDDDSESRAYFERRARESLARRRRYYDMMKRGRNKHSEESASGDDSPKIEINTQMQKMLDELNKRREKYNGEQSEDKDEQKTADSEFVLIDCIKSGLQRVDNERFYILGLKGEMLLRFKFVRYGDSACFSDDGMTVPQVNQTERKIKNVLKGFASAELKNGEIIIPIAHPAATFAALLNLYAAVEAVKRIK